MRIDGIYQVTIETSSGEVIFRGTSGTAQVVHTEVKGDVKQGEPARPVHYVTVSMELADDD